MISPIEYIQLKAFARQDGFILGIVWIIAFSCFIGSMSDSSWQLGFIIGVLSTPFVVYYLLRHYRDDVLTGSISFKRAFAFNALIIIYASIILAAATFVYFYFLDHGNFFGTLMANIKLPEVQQSFRDAGMDPKDVEAQLSIITESRPIDFAFSIFFDGILLSLTLGSIIAIIGRRKARQYAK